MNPLKTRNVAIHKRMKGPDFSVVLKLLAKSLMFLVKDPLDTPCFSSGGVPCSGVRLTGSGLSLNLSFRNIAGKMPNPIVAIPTAIASQDAPSARLSNSKSHCINQRNHGAIK